MLHVSIPNNNLPEREYIIEVMLTGFLGLPYSLTPGPDPTAYHLCFDGAELVIRDHFFSRYPLHYPTWSKRPFLFGQDS